ncbi:hypothetical protein CA256_03170 [Sphingomonas koreensis]|nr:hypothetical protein CA256_03170 [Sphingomonas koreensis]
MEPHQGRFAKALGISQKRQSFLETGTRELRADYLEQIAPLGLDVLYIVTGQRSGGALTKFESRFLGALRRVSETDQQAVFTIVQSLAGDVPPDAVPPPEPTPRPMLHDGPQPYRGERD